MKNLIKHMATALACMAIAAGFQSCQDDVDAPGLNVPVATLKANTDIATVKAKYWEDTDNYYQQIPADAHEIIAGRVISSDASGNIYKNLVIQDATGALAMSINANSLYNEYRIGQEIVIDLAGMYIGKYSTLEQLGFPDHTAAYGDQTTFMPLEFFVEHSQLNGLPDASKIDTLTIQLSDLGNGNAEQMKYQSQLVRLNNVYFVDGGEKAFCDGHKVNTNRTLKDDAGNEIIVRTSGYANYWSMTLPAEHGDVVGILSTYKSSGSLKWQLLMRSPSDLLNFGNPTLPKGTETNPYDILEAIQMVADNKPVSGWYTGYIVGSIKAGESDVTSPDMIIWGKDAELQTTLIIGQTEDSNSLSDVVAIFLPYDSKLLEYGNLVDNPGNYKKQIWIKGTPGKDFGMNALTGNAGTSSEFRIEGVTVPGDTPAGSIAAGDGTEASPYNPTQVVEMGTSANVADKWVTGYIVGWVDGSKQNYADETNCIFTVPATLATNVLIASTADEKDWSKCACVNLPNTNNIRAAVNLMDNPSNLGKQLSVKGTIRKYFNMPAVRDLTAYKLEGGSDTPTPDPGTSTTPSGAGTASDPYNAAKALEVASALDESGQVADVYVKGKVTAIKELSTQYGNATYSIGDETTSFSIYRGNYLNGDKFTSEDQLKVGDEVVVCGTLVNFKGNTPQMTTGSKIISINGSTSGSTGGEEPKPDTPVTSGTTADFGTMAASSSYKAEVTSTDGWVAKNAAIQTGGEKDNNPAFTAIGSSADIHAVCLNGKSSAPGSLTSPTLTGGIKSLTFKYGFMFSDKQCKFTVNIKQGGSVVKTQTVDLSTVTKFEVYTFTMTDLNINGDYTIEITNDCKTGTDKNVDRLSIWDLSWTK